MSTILVSPSPEVIAAVNIIITGALGGMLFNLILYCNLSSKCVTEPYSRNYGGSYYWARYIGKNSINNVIITSRVVA